MVKISVKVLPDGSVKLEVKGIKGEKCLNFTKDFEEAIGDVVQRYYTSEFYQKENVNLYENYKEKRKLGDNR